MNKFPTIAALALLVVPATGTGQAASPDEIEAGRAIYGEYCASCHGADAEGAPGWQKPDANGELPAPPHNGDGHTWRHSDGETTEMIAEGWRDPFNKTDRLTMPAFGAILKPEEIAAVVAYLKTLWTDEQRQFQSDKTQESSGPAASN